jgi:hypothetical protein
LTDDDFAAAAAALAAGAAIDDIYMPILTFFPKISSK